MRERKFQIYNSQTKEMNDWVSVKRKFNLNIFDESLDYYHIREYTGLTDKNGKEIYEGDIVEYKTRKPKEVINKDNNFAGFSLKNTDLFLMDYDTKEMEIIGNIYENPIEGES